MKVPEKINFGDKIGVLSTARYISSNELEPALKLIKSWGLRVVLGKFLFEKQNQFAGTVNQRVSDFQNMINDCSIKAIICVRGGYGTVHIIDQIDFSVLIANPKWVVGYSDITVLHAHLNKLGIATLHATMPINFSNNTKDSLESLRAALFGRQKNIEAPPHRLNILGNVRGEIVGGNLSVIYSLLGSNSDIETEGKILFLEDLDEYLYHIDRMIINLKRNYKFENLKGMIIGSMTQMHDNKIPFGKDAEEIILTHIREYDLPICFGFPSGHLADNKTIKFGVETVLEINENGVNLYQY